MLHLQQAIIKLKNKFSDILSFVSTLNASKIINAIRVVSSFYVSKWLKKPIHWGMPVSISIEPTTSCNLRCPECPSGLRNFTRPTGMLKQDFFQNTIDEVYKKTAYLIFYFQGEPYLNPQFLDMVKYASDKKIYTATSTNAHYLTSENAKKTVESGLKRLIISIDGTTQETYQQYRIGGDLEKVIAGTKNIIHWKKQLKSKTPHVIFQYLVVKPNEHQLEDAKKLADELGVNEIKFKTAQIYEYENGSELIPSLDKYSRYKKNKEGKFEIKNNLLNNCWRLWHSTVITWDGLVVPCCFDKDATHQLGDLKQHDFKSIWNGSNYNTFRASLVRSRSEIDICKNCTEGTKVWA